MQVGDALVFGDQELLRNVYASQRPDVSAVIEGILGQHMTVQTTILDYFISTAEAAEWTTEEIDLRLRRIVDTTTIGEIRIVDSRRGTIYSNFPPGGADRSLADTPHFEDLGALLDGLEPVAEHPTSPRASNGTVYKYVTRASRDSSRLIQVGVPIESSAGNLLYSVYQQQARHPGPFPKPPGALDRQSRG